MQPTQPLAKVVGRRLALTTKGAGKNFYKGTGSGSMGWHTKHGGYRIDWNKVRTYKVPDLTDFQLTPFVAKRVEKEPGRFPGASPLSGRLYLERWKRDGGQY